MPRSNPVRRTTLEGFLELEARSQTRHEFVDGLMFAMAGGTDYHNRLTTRFLVTIFELKHVGVEELTTLFRTRHYF
jgi:Uma2 family endonuclease